MFDLNILQERVNISQSIIIFEIECGLFGDTITFTEIPANITVRDFVKCVMKVNLSNFTNINNFVYLNSDSIIAEADHNILINIVNRLQNCIFHYDGKIYHDTELPDTNGILTDTVRDTLGFVVIVYKKPILDTLKIFDHVMQLNSSASNNVNIPIADLLSSVMHYENEILYIKYKKVKTYIAIPHTVAEFIHKLYYINELHTINITESRFYWRFMVGQIKFRIRVTKYIADLFDALHGELFYILNDTVYHCSQTPALSEIYMVVAKLGAASKLRQYVDVVKTCGITIVKFDYAINDLLDTDIPAKYEIDKANYLRKIYRERYNAGNIIKY